jgi:hypothetical protein
MSVLAYHGVDAGTHRQRVNDLAAAAFAQSRSTFRETRATHATPRFGWSALDLTGRSSRISPPASIRRVSTS